MLRFIHFGFASAAVAVDSCHMTASSPASWSRFSPPASWMDNIKTWTGLSVEESIKMTEDRDKWRKYVHGVANPRIEDG